MRIANRTKLAAGLGVALGIAVLCASSAAFAQELEKSSKPMAVGSVANPAVLSAQILARWEPVAQAAGAYYPAWREVFAAQLNAMDVRTLAKLDRVTADVVNAKADYARFTQAFVDAQANRIMNPSSDKTHAKLGSATTDQVFIPVVPCRIVDTRNVGGPIAVGSPRNFYMFDTGLFAYNWNTTQGGATSCPGTNFFLSSANPSAALLTVGVVSPSAAGNWVIWGGANPIPNSTALNWSGTGQILVNTTVVPAGGRAGTGPGGAILDFAVAYNGPSGSAQFTADVVGYFIENVATALQCVYLENSGTGTGNFTTGTHLTVSLPACTSGYTRTGSGCSTAIFLSNNIYLYETSPNSFTDCIWQNNSGATQNANNFNAESVCCRVPGR